MTLRSGYEIICKQVQLYIFRKLISTTMQLNVWHLHVLGIWYALRKQILGNNHVLLFLNNICCFPVMVSLIIFNLTAVRKKGPYSCFVDRQPRQNPNLTAPSAVQWAAMHISSHYCNYWMHHI